MIWSSTPACSAGSFISVASIAGYGPFAVGLLGLHHIEDDLEQTWLEDWAAVGIAELESYLAKHAAFLAFLETHKQ